jgi:lycopene cyclase domain-containing protein
MTYLQFHLVFIVPPLLALLVTQPRPLAGIGGRRPVRYLQLMSFVAFLYTTPWDNYLIYSGVWSYGPERVIGTIGYVPIEEYLFFLLQPLLAGFGFFHLQARAARRPLTPSTTGRLPNVVGAVAWLAAAFVGWRLLQVEQGRYMGLILVWAAPVLAGQWALRGGYFWQARRLGLAAVMLPTAYLWVADRIAIGLNIWSIAEATTLGWRPLGLPVEEAVFFLLTNLLVIQGLMMFLPLPDTGAPPHPSLQHNEASGIPLRDVT